MNDSAASEATLRIQEADDLAASTGSLLDRLINEIQLRLTARQWQAYSVWVGAKLEMDRVGQVLMPPVTRQRVEQLVTEANKRLRQILEAPDFRAVTSRVSTFSHTLGSAAPIAHDLTVAAVAELLGDVSPGNQDLAKRILLYLASRFSESGGWRQLDSPSGRKHRARSADDGWLQLGTGPDSEAYDSHVPELLTTADEFGVISDAALRGHLDRIGVRWVFRDEWLAANGFDDLGTAATRATTSIVDRCVACLAVGGAPADVETLLRRLDERRNLRDVRNRLSDDDRLMKISPTQWALKAWDIAEYGGVVQAISDRIRERGGSANLKMLAEEFERTFHVRAGSVTTLARARMFVIEGDLVRQRRTDEHLVVEGELAQCRGVFRLRSGRIAVLVRVDGEAFRGSGVPFNSVVARELGVLSGMYVRSFGGLSCEVVIRWSESAFRPSLSSILPILLDLEARLGDFVRFDFDRSSESVTATRIPASVADMPGELGVPMLTGIEQTNDVLGELALSLGVSRTEVGGVLSERGDDLIASLLLRLADDAGAPR